MCSCTLTFNCIFYEWYNLWYYIHHIVLFELHHSSLGSCDWHTPTLCPPWQCGSVTVHDCPTPSECGGASGECVVTDVILSSQLGQPRENKDALPRHVQLTLGEWQQHGSELSCMPTPHPQSPTGGCGTPSRTMKYVQYSRRWLVTTWVS